MFSLKSKNNSSAFTELLDEGLKVKKELQKLYGEGKLSSGSYDRGALLNAGITENRRDELAKVIESGPQFQMTREYIKKAVRSIGDGNYSVPPRHLNRITFLPPTEFSIMTGELAAIGCSPLAAFAVAVKRAIQEYPHVFGTIEDMTQHQAKIKECESRLQSLYQSIETSWTKADIDIISAGGDLAYIRYKGTEVSVFGRNSGESLISHLAGPKNGDKGAVT